MLTFTDFIELGPCPADEMPIQLGEPGFMDKAREQCELYANLIRAKMGVEPAATRITVRWFEHDFGYYPEVVCMYDREMEPSVDYAFRCESEAPKTWEG